MSTTQAIPTASDTRAFQDKVKRLVEMEKAVKTLQQQVTITKQELLDHFEHHPQLKKNKYRLDQYTVRYAERKGSDSLSYVLIRSGLNAYFKRQNMPDTERHVQEVIETIKQQRHAKITPFIDVSQQRGVSAPASP